MFAKRRIGPVAALAPTLVLLFYGSDPIHALLGNGFTVLLALAAGLGALLALDRGDLKGDLCACLLLCLGPRHLFRGASLPGRRGGADPDRERPLAPSLGVPAPGGALRDVVPLVSNPGWENRDTTHLSNLLLAPNWAFNSLAAVGSSLLGLNYPPLGSGWGPVVAVAALVALGWRLWRGNIPRWLWVTMTVPAALWLIASGSAAPPVRVPQKTEYMFPATIAVLLVAVEVVRGLRLQRRGMIILYAAAAIGLATNIALLRDSARQFRDTTVMYRSDLTASEIIGRFSGLPAYLAITSGHPEEGNYLDAVRRFGSPAFPLASLHRQSEPIREMVDGILAENLGLHLQPSSLPSTPCRLIKGKSGRAVSFELPSGGVVLKAGGESGPLTLRRFGSSFTVQAGQLTRRQWTELLVPSDLAPDRWYASTSAPFVAVCGPPQH